MMLRFDALLYPQDGFVLVGSVAGQRYWSTVLNQESIITTGTWTPDDQQVFFYYFFLNLFRKVILKCLAKITWQQVYLGTSSGSIVVLDVHNGAVVAQIQMSEPTSISPGSISSNSTNHTSAANGIRQLAWNCPRFKMEEPTSSTTNAGRQTTSADGHLLSSMSNGGKIYDNIPLFPRYYWIFGFFCGWD